MPGFLKLTKCEPSDEEYYVLVNLACIVSVNEEFDCTLTVSMTDGARWHVSNRLDDIVYAMSIDCNVNTQ